MGGQRNGWLWTALRAAEVRRVGAMRAAGWACQLRSGRCSIPVYVQKWVENGVAKLGILKGGRARGRNVAAVVCFCAWACHLCAMHASATHLSADLQGTVGGRCYGSWRLFEQTCGAWAGVGHPVLLNRPFKRFDAY